MPSKLRIKFGSIEFEYEGDAEFSPNSIKDLFSHFETMTKVAASVAPAAISAPAAASVTPDSPVAQMHTNSIASKLGAPTAADLAVAAAAHLQLVESLPTFSRTQLVTDMKSATAFYKVNMLGNIGQTLKSLVTKKRFVQNADDEFSLSAAERESVVTKLA